MNPRIAYQTIWDRCQHTAEVYDALKYLQALAEMPSEKQWIPCSESLPKESGFYLCTLHYAIPPYHMFHPENDIYVDEVSVQKFDGKFIDSVVAWMPRPKPYKVESEGVKQ